MRHCMWRLMIMHRPRCSLCVPQKSFGFSLLKHAMQCTGRENADIVCCVETAALWHDSPRATEACDVLYVYLPETIPTRKEGSGLIGTPWVRPDRADNSAHGSGASAQLSGRRSRLLAAQLRGLPGQYHPWLFGLDSGATSVA